VDEGAFRLAGDPLVTYLPPQSPGDVPALDFGPLVQAAARLKKAARAYDDAFARASDSDFKLSARDQAQLNAILQGIEQTLTSKRGLPGRPWYQHMLYAPGLYTGYGAKTLPAVREAIELHHWPDAIDYISVVAASLDVASARVEQASALLLPKANAAASGAAVTPPPPPDN
jgi:N-acetylated-alpha-linked acidic dipeptidase